VEISSQVELTRLQRVQRAIHFMENHLTEPITIADAADAACYSLYHFCRTFNSVAHHSPYDYLMRRRLSQAAERLVESRSKIIDIAFDYQFNSPESFSRAFKKMFSVQPKQYRNRGSLDRRQLLTELTSERLDLMSRAVSLIPERTHLDGSTLSGLMGPIQEDAGLVAGLWEDLNTDHPLEGETDVSSLSSHLGVAGFPQGWNRSGFYYSAAVPRQGTGESNPAMVTTQLPAGDYARFTFKAKLRELIAILEYVFQTWLPNSDYSPDIPFVILSYGRKPSGVDDGEIVQQVFVPLG